MVTIILFHEAASALDNVIGVYSLVSDYGSQFLRFGENGPEGPKK